MHLVFERESIKTTCGVYCPCICPCLSGIKTKYQSEKQLGTSSHRFWVHCIEIWYCQRLAEGRLSSTGITLVQGDGADIKAAYWWPSETKMWVLPLWLQCAMDPRSISRGGEEMVDFFAYHNFAVDEPSQRPPKAAVVHSSTLPIHHKVGNECCTGQKLSVAALRRLGTSSSHPALQTYERISKRVCTFLKGPEQSCCIIILYIYITPIHLWLIVIYIILYYIIFYIHTIFSYIHGYGQILLESKADFHK